MRILAIITGEYGQRHVDNIRAHGPEDWRIEAWQSPRVLPPILDYPEDYLPETLPRADLILSFGEIPAIAELLPVAAAMSGAKAVIAPIDREEWLPRGLARQLRGWLAEQGVNCVTPKPLCSLTETEYNLRRQRLTYDDPIIAEFARHFGRPQFRITVDPFTRLITAAEPVRDAVCGCARYVAENLVGVAADDAEEKAGLLHHHYPCLASMGVDPQLHDTLMHVSGNIFKDEVGDQVREFREIAVIVPAERSQP